MAGAARGLTRTVKAETRFRRVDYAGAVFRMDYESFERTALKARQAEPDPCKSIYELVRRHDPSAGEAELVEALSRNLARGRAVIAVVGDGIRDGIAPLAELLQSHAGHRDSHLPGNPHCEAGAKLNA